MANLNEQDRVNVWSEWMEKLSEEREGLGITKSDLRAAINGIDDYIETNQVAINLAIPQPARAGLTTKQKAQILSYVVLKRYKVI